MKSFYPVLYLCFLFGLLPFLGSCSEENESSGTIEMNQLPGTAQSFLSNYFPGQTPEKIERIPIRKMPGCFIVLFFPMKSKWNLVKMEDGKD